MRSSGGVLWLRIDDCDRRRVRPEYIKDIFETLEWLNINWDCGPKNYDDFEQNYSQEKRSKYYFKQVERINTYACRCSRREIRERGTIVGYDQFCRNKELAFIAGESALRFCSNNDDFVVWTKDNHPSYQLASVVDDFDMGINLIVRGDDLLESTEMQKELASAFGYQLPPTQFHKLLRDSKNQKLSKSNRSNSIRAMRKRGVSAAQILQMVEEFLATY